MPNPRPAPGRGPRMPRRGPSPRKPHHVHPRYGPDRRAPPFRVQWTHWECARANTQVRLSPLRHPHSTRSVQVAVHKLPLNPAPEPWSVGTGEPTSTRSSPPAASTPRPTPLRRAASSTLSTPPTPTFRRPGRGPRANPRDRGPPRGAQVVHDPDRGDPERDEPVHERGADEATATVESPVNRSRFPGQVGGLNQAALGASS